VDWGLEVVTELRLPAPLYDDLVAHGRRKLARDFRDDETHEQHAFGLVGGRLEGEVVEATHVFALRRNMRHEPPYRDLVDGTVHRLAVPSVTPTKRRGWFADPREVLAAHTRCEADGSTLVGSYHMHKVPWDGDPLRDTPTALDTEMHGEQGTFMLILSLVEPERPRLRAFYDGRPEREVRVVVPAGQPAAP
jgi:hypothetical protein